MKKQLSISLLLNASFLLFTIELSAADWLSPTAWKEWYQGNKEEENKNKTKGPVENGNVEQEITIAKNPKQIKITEDYFTEEKQANLQIEHKKNWKKMQKELITALKNLFAEENAILSSLQDQLQANKIKLVSIIETKNANDLLNMQNFKKIDPRIYKNFELLFDESKGIRKITELRGALIGMDNPPTGTDKPPYDFNSAKDQLKTLYGQMIQIARSLYNEKHAKIEQVKEDFHQAILDMLKIWNNFSVEVIKICKENNIVFSGKSKIKGTEEQKILEKKNNELLLLVTQRLEEIGKLEKDGDETVKKTAVETRKNIRNLFRSFEHYWGFFPTLEELQKTTENLYEATKKAIATEINQFKKIILKEEKKEGFEVIEVNPFGEAEEL